MTPTLTIRGRSSWVEMNTRLRGLSERIKLGVFGGVTPDGQSLAEVMAAQEYGTSTIPARPSLGPTIRGSRVMIVRRLSEICGDTIRGDRAPRSSLESLARDLTTAVRHRILSTNIPPPLAEATIRRKRDSMADGLSPDHPLVHTRRLVDSITWRLV